jgi:hypothetical protein
MAPIQTPSPLDVIFGPSKYKLAGYIEFSLMMADEVNLNTNL